MNEGLLLPQRGGNRYWIQLVQRPWGGPGPLGKWKEGNGAEGRNSVEEGKDGSERGVGTFGTLFWEQFESNLNLKPWRWFGDVEGHWWWNGSFHQFTSIYWVSYHMSRTILLARDALVSKTKICLLGPYIVIWEVVVRVSIKGKRI